MEAKDWYKKWWVWVIVVAVVVVVSSPQSSTPKIEIPKAQEQFIAAIEDGKTKVSLWQNDLRNAVALRDRDKALCAVLSSFSAFDWIGEIDEIGATDKGKAHISIIIAKDVTLRTDDNDSGYDRHTLIPESSPVFKQVLPLRDGAKIKFSAVFMRGESTCLKSGNWYEFNYARKPEFIVKVTNVELIK